MSTGTAARRTVRHLAGAVEGRDRKLAVALLRELRGALTAEAAGEFLTEAMATGYELGLLEAGGGSTAPVALAGFRVLATSRGRILMLEDLVVCASRRRSGDGAALLAWLTGVARSRRCARIELDTGVSNEAAQAFYARHGMAAGALHFSLDV